MPESHRLAQDFKGAERKVVTIGEAVREAAAVLSRTTDTPRLDAELLMAHELGVSREALLLDGMGGEAPEAFQQLTARRAAGEPIAYITGRREFWSLDLEVGPGVLVPRPDSETLIEAAMEHFRDRSPATILDLGTGPGTLLLAALTQWPQARGMGVDRSETALGYARRNAGRLGLVSRADFRLGDWAQGIEPRFDLILCNPPYVEAAADLPRDVAGWEPHEALFAGGDGLAEYRRIAPAIRDLLAPGGAACIEIGAGQEREVTELFGAQHFTISSRKDLSNHVRCLVLTD